MPRRREATLDDIRAFHAFGKTSMTPDEFEIAKARGIRIEFEESSFSDPGEDWTAIYLGGRCIGRWEGY